MSAGGHGCQPANDWPDAVAVEEDRSATLGSRDTATSGSRTLGSRDTATSGSATLGGCHTATSGSAMLGSRHTATSGSATLGSRHTATSGPTHHLPRVPAGMVQLVEGTIDGSAKAGWARTINHSCDPNIM